MTHLRNIRRTLTGLTVALAAAFVLVPHAPAAPVAVVRPSLRLSWTPALSREFPGCQARVSGVAAAFVVERESGEYQRLPFDRVWRWTHSTSGTQVWVVGQCKEA